MYSICFWLTFPNKKPQNTEREEVCVSTWQSECKLCSSNLYTETEAREVKLTQQSKVLKITPFSSSYLSIYLTVMILNWIRHTGDGQWSRHTVNGIVEQAYY